MIPKGKKRKLTPIRKTVLQNKQAIERLQDLPDKVDAILGIIAANADQTGDGEVQTAVTNEIDDSTDPISNLIGRSGKDNELANESTADVNLIEALNVMQPETELGEPIDPEVAKSITELFQTDKMKAIKEKVKDKFKIPSNCLSLSVPRVNQEIWSLLPAPVKQKDYSIQQHQQLISTASVALAKMTNTLFTTKEPMKQALKEELIRNCMEATSVLAIASEDMNKKRKLEMRPSLNKTYSNICVTSKSGGGFLFGDNVIEQIKATRNSSQLVRPAFPKTFGRGYHNFQFRGRNLNYYSPSNRGRGAFRYNQPRGYQPFQRPQSNFKNRNQHQQ